MNMFSLRALIDDILLLVRNNNISESEDLSRAQIAAWILAYRAAIIKDQKDKEKDGNESSEDTSLTSLLETRGPLELQYEDSLDDTRLCRRRTKEKIPAIIDNDERNLISVQDQEGAPIQMMNEQRKFFHRFRKYTSHELTYWYENGYIYIQGDEDCGQLQYIWITGIFDDQDSEDCDEDEVKIPGWMIPKIKKMILDNELSFMLQRISDDDNNSTIDGIKPQSQSQIGNEK